MTSDRGRTLSSSHCGVTEARNKRPYFPFMNNYMDKLLSVYDLALFVNLVV